MEGDGDQVRVDGHYGVVGIGHMNETMNSIKRLINSALQPHNL